MIPRYQFNLRWLFRLVALAALVAMAVRFMIHFEPPAMNDPAVAAIWVALGLIAAGATIGSLVDKDAIRGAVVGAAFALLLVTFIVLAGVRAKG